ncbi:MAG: hypothetical protein N4A72_14715 [Bacteroidales bacterium]|jgi:hypothetical protein|nr:hypothetical protein [Bacteroidales bacterium]
MTTLSAGGFYLEDAYTLFGVTDFREIFYNANGSAKTEAEVKAKVGGIFDSRYCSGISDFIAKKDARCLLGYVHNVLDITPDSVSLFHLIGAQTNITIVASHPWSVESVDFFYTVNPPTGGIGSTNVVIEAKGTNDTDYNFTGQFTVRTSQKTATVNVRQDCNPTGRVRG